MVGQVPGKWQLLGPGRLSKYKYFDDDHFRCLLYVKLSVKGLIDLRAGSPIELTESMAKGFDMGVVVMLDYIESLATFFTHPSHDEYVKSLPYLELWKQGRADFIWHIRVNELYEEVCVDGSTVGYDIEFWNELNPQ